MDWQPIETALPTRLLLFGNTRHDVGIVFTGWKSLNGRVYAEVWEAEDGNPACQDANGCGKLYRVIVSHDGTAVLRHNASLRDQEAHGSEEPAKAAAQADYERRILSALEHYDD